MRKVLTTALAVVTAAGAILATAAPAQAERYRHHYRHGGHHGGNNDEVAAAIIGGVAGLALGAAIAGNSSQRTRSSGYYQNGYAYDPRYDSYRGGYSYSEPRYTSRTCISRERVYDHYLDRPVTIERRYAC